MKTKTKYSSIILYVCLMLPSIYFVFRANGLVNTDYVTSRVYLFYTLIFFLVPLCWKIAEESIE